MTKSEPTPARRVRDAVDRRQLLVDSARGLFAIRPYDEVTTSEIAATAGVAYGLIAHHFSNKRGLYRAVMNDIAVEIAAVQLAEATADGTVADRLRHALRTHISYIDDHAESFVALVRGHLGVDQEQQGAVDELRWLGALRVLKALGVSEPISPVMRVAMHGWVGYLDEMMIQRIATREVGEAAIVELAAAALVTTLRSVSALGGGQAPPAQLNDLLETFQIDPAATSAD